MNCCDAYGNCRQGRDCPARGPAVVAPIKQSITRCQELGVCQSLSPCCSGCSITTSIEQQDVFDRVTYYMAIGIATGCTVAVAVGGVSYLLHYFKWLSL
jgi:hypothetical protein